FLAHRHPPPGEWRENPLRSAAAARTTGIYRVHQEDQDVMSRKFDLLVFDWDGTLMDSAAAIAESLQAACAELGVPVPDDRRARYVIGLGLTDALAYAVPDLEPSQYPRLLD